MGIFKKFFGKKKESNDQNNDETIRQNNEETNVQNGDKTISQNDDETRLSDELKDLFQIITLGHMLLIRDSWPIAFTKETSGILPLLDSFFEKDTPIIREKIRKYIEDNNIIRDDNPIFYARVLAERLVFSKYLLNLFNALRIKNKNPEKLGQLINNIFASMLKLSPAEYIEIFSDYFLKNKFFDQINDEIYEQCLNTMLMVTFATGNESLGVSIINKRNERQLGKIERDILFDHFQFAERRFGKLDKEWIYKYI